MQIKKLLCLLLMLTLALSLIACGGENVETQPTAGTEPQATTVPTQTEPATEPAITVEVPITYLNVSCNQTTDDMFYMTASNEDGSAYVEYAGEIKKAGNLDGQVLYQLAAAMETSGMKALHGRSEYTEGEAGGYFYVTYADGTILTADFTGTIPQEFLNAYAAMEAVFQSLTADMPEYIPEAMVVGEVNADALAAIQDILNNSGMKDLDALMINDIPLDDFFNYTAGLSGNYGITSGTACTAMMMTTPYSLVVVTMDERASEDYVCADFQRSMDWGKWVCVSPSNALIAKKDNMMLCLMGSDDMYALTAASITNAGWTELKTMENPNL